MLPINAFVVKSNLTPKSIYWIKTFSKFISVQIVVQLISVLTGIFIIHSLSKEEYAYFTIANNINATLNILSNLGISAALLAIGSKIWTDKYRFGQLINSAIRLRYLFAAIAIGICLPPMLWLLVARGASVAYTGLIAILVLFGLNFQLNTVVLRTIPKLHSQVAQLQQLDFIQALIRLLVVGVESFFYLNAALTISASILASGVENYLLRRWFNKFIDITAPIDNTYRRSIFKIVKNHAPESIFYTFQGQIQIWLIGIFGTTANVAEVGALSRLAVLFSIISSIMTNIVVPSFSRYQSTHIMKVRYIQVVGILGMISFILMILAISFPAELLWILGGKYAYLQAEVFWVILVSILGAFTGVLWQINAARGWVDYAWVNIPLTIVLQILFLIYGDVTSVHGVLLFSLFSGLPWFGINILITWHNLFRQT